MSNSSQFTAKASAEQHSAAAANEAPAMPEGTTLFDLVAALQDAADESTHSQEDADLLVFASLVELRHYLRSTNEVGERKVA